MITLRRNKSKQRVYSCFEEFIRQEIGDQIVIDHYGLMWFFDGEDHTFSCMNDCQGQLITFPITNVNYTLTVTERG